MKAPHLSHPQPPSLNEPSRPVPTLPKLNISVPQRRTTLTRIPTRQTAEIRRLNRHRPLRSRTLRHTKLRILDRPHSHNPTSHRVSKRPQPRASIITNLCLRGSKGRVRVHRPYLLDSRRATIRHRTLATETRHQHPTLLVHRPTQEPHSIHRTGLQAKSPAAPWTAHGSRTPVGPLSHPLLPQVRRLQGLPHGPQVPQAPHLLGSKELLGLVSDAVQVPTQQQMEMAATHRVLWARPPRERARSLQPRSSAQRRIRRVAWITVGQGVFLVRRTRRV